MTSPAIAAVIPVYNDRKALERAIPVSLQYLGEITPDFELIIAEDGSTDGSAELVRETSRTEPRVRLLHSDERLGRGMALNRAFGETSAPIVLYYDVDLATGMEHLRELSGLSGTAMISQQGQDFCRIAGSGEPGEGNSPAGDIISSSGQSSGAGYMITSAGSNRSAATGSCYLQKKSGNVTGSGILRSWSGPSGTVTG